MPGVKGAKAMKNIAGLVCSAVAVFAGEVPPVDEVVAKMMECDRARQMEIGSYSFTSDYVLQNKDRHAEMVVRWTRHADGVKEFAVMSESGYGGVRKHVFHRLLQAEWKRRGPNSKRKPGSHRIITHLN
jgi:hypothetical protein